MTTALAIIGVIAGLLGTATKIPLAATAFVRACIPLITAVHDLRDALHRNHSCMMIQRRPGAKMAQPGTLEPLAGRVSVDDPARPLDLDSQ